MVECLRGLCPSGRFYGVNDASLNDIETEFSKLVAAGEKLKEEAVFVLFFSGHGEERDGRLQLLPVRGDQGFDVKEAVGRVVRVAPPKSLIFLFCDCCRYEESNDVWRSSVPDGNARHARPAVSRLAIRCLMQTVNGADKDLGCMQVFACAPGSYSYEDTTGEGGSACRGFFTRALTAHLATPEPFYTLFPMEIAPQVKREVREKHGKIQEPWHETNFSGNQVKFCFSESLWPLKNKRTPDLFNAIEADDAVAVKRLIAGGIQINCRSSRGLQPQKARKKGAESDEEEGIVEEYYPSLSDLECDPQKDNKKRRKKRGVVGWTAFEFALQTGMFSAAEELTRPHGPNGQMILRVRDFDRFPLHRLIMWGPGYKEREVEEGAPLWRVADRLAQVPNLGVKSRNKQGDTPLLQLARERLYGREIRIPCLLCGRVCS